MMNVANGKRCKTLSSNETEGWSVSALTDGEKGGTGWSSKVYSQVGPNNSKYGMLPTPGEF